MADLVKRLLSDAIDQQAAVLYLLRAWDVAAPAHELHAQFTALETCARRAETMLCNAMEKLEVQASDESEARAQTVRLIARMRRPPSPGEMKDGRHG